MRRAQPEARAEFFRRYAPQVRRILFLQGLCDEVDDAVQEVFIKVFRADLPTEERFLAWFYRLILNTGRDQGRRRKTRRGLVERLEELAPADRAPGAAAASADPAQRAAAADPALRSALDGLTPDFRETVALRFFADLSLESIAAAQDVPLGTVKSRLHMALSRLRRALTEAGFDNG
jgi:RNA polymerase sigma-70 factor (ECF subfamily)